MQDLWQECDNSYYW